MPSEAEICPAGEAPSATLPPTGYRAWIELTKPRLSVLSVLTALVGYLAARPDWSPMEFLALSLGTLLSACGALTLNQWYEADIDGLMERTRDRPIPSGRVPRNTALRLGLVLAFSGPLVLLLGTHWLAATRSVLTVLSSTLVYTPLKRRSRWAMEIGAVSGSLPPMIGWAAAEGALPAMAWILFGVLTCWQMPHFLAIAWTYRRDYEAAHLPLHSVEAGRGHTVALGSSVWSLGLIALSLLPQLLGEASWIYSAGSLLVGAWFAQASFRWLRDGLDASARSVFLRSLVYLPLWMLLLGVDRILLSN